MGLVKTLFDACMAILQIELNVLEYTFSLFDVMCFVVLVGIIVDLFFGMME